MYDYTAGKLDWLAAGLPSEGDNASHPRAGDLARTDVPTCGLDDRLGDVAERAAASGWNAAVVVNADTIVFGLLRRDELGGDPGARIEDVMRPGPSTFRPHVSASRMAAFMTEHDLENCPITTSGGRLVGLLLRDDAVRAAHAGHGKEES